MTFSGCEKKYQVQLDESAVIKSIHADEDVFNLLGKELCVVIDIALTKGGPKAVVDRVILLCSKVPATSRGTNK